LHVVLLVNFFLKERVDSVDKIYKNSSWLEREVSEMSGINYSFKKDVRKLLLDYSKNENPLLKDFPVEGFSEIFYDFFEDQTIFLDSNVVEL
jgi:NADH-quinone oxidoreductase subunit C